MEYTDIDESTKEFYLYLGLLSTKFSAIEYKVLQILSLLMGDDFILAGILFENNPLYTNMGFVQKISEHRWFKIKSIKELNVKINGIRKSRNLFVHGTWSQPYKSKGTVMIKCFEPKINQQKKYHKDELVFTSTSQRTEHTFKISTIKDLVIKLDEIINEQDLLIVELEEYLEENNNWE